MSLIELNIYFFLEELVYVVFLFKAKHPDIIMLAKCLDFLGIFN